MFMSGPIVRRYGFPNFEKIFGERPLQHGSDEPDQTASQAKDQSVSRAENQSAASATSSSAKKKE
jgi:hypothetical protein